MSFAFIDAHVHFWDRQTLSYPWLDHVPAIAGRHTPAELIVESAPLSPEKIVFVECGAPWRDEVKWVEQLAALYPSVAGIVAAATMNAGAETAAAIAELIQHPLVRGVRHLIQDESDPNYCLCPAFVAGVQQLAAAGLSFDLCCREHQLSAVVELVRRCPEVSFILDHAGKPLIKDQILEPWKTHLRVLAALPNSVCKFSGLITEANPASWTRDHLRPYTLHLLETFGPSRLLFGSDWPVDKLAGSYTRWLETARELLSELKAADQSAIFYRNAQRVYRID